MFLIYNILLTFTFFFWVPYVLWIIYKSKGKIKWKELCGDYAVTSKENNIWVHAVSGGEVIAVSSILKKLKQLRPDHNIILTTTTTAGHEAAKRLGSLVDQIFYFPLDVARFQLSAMSRVRPKVVVIMETELWMNFLWSAKAVGAKTMILNGRLSDHHYPRNLKIKFFYKALLKNLDAVYAQTEIDAQRFKSIGALRVEVLGNSKYDQAADLVGEVDIQGWKNRLYIPENKTILVIGTTRSRREEKMILKVLQQLDLTQLHIIHAPRHLEHVPEIVKDLENNQIPYSLRSQPTQGANYTLLDSFGELAQVYALADIVILGGSFEDQLVGANLMQPLALSKPLIHGSGMKDFAEASEMAHKAGATLIASSAEELKQFLEELLQSPEKRKDLSDRAFTFVQANRGASEQYAKRIIEAL